jgi:hypothetical protein
VSFGYINIVRYDSTLKGLLIGNKKKRISTISFSTIDSHMKYNLIKYCLYKTGLASSECQPYQRRVYLTTSLGDGKNAL